MTALILILAAGVLADVVLHTLVLLALRETLHTLKLRESARRGWGPRVGDAELFRRSVMEDARDGK